MIVGFQYTAMTITGAFHLGIGVLCFIISMVGYSTKLYRYMGDWNLSVATSTPAFIISLWVILVGIFGILAGLKSNTELQTRRMKITYMVLAILSACLFAIAGISVFAFHATLVKLNGYHNLYPLFCVGSFAMFVEFVMAIVSSSICCCCSQTKSSVVVVQQNQATEFMNPSINS
ncbi:uncharacterized protein LOC106868670 [Octopus bimaculoides]|uniref:Uncharacterized protein n=1 Tax=Octopus bimaculoides TaxID=37653 RepID=A0A0L8HTK8_OCTBM|nr:uncharacterized protein LOC106868670 [Octopus bimaculoides]|eukprot:XP_014769532.1 PREDICTED: uncharacterized protein LOC106868670 [Octopus bimaculoides]